MAARKTKLVQATVKKEFIAREGGTPEYRPLYVNHFQVSRHEADWFLDVGVLPIDDLLSRQPEIRFAVSQRLAMSLPTMKKLRDQITEVLEKSAEGAANVETQTSRQNAKTARKPRSKSNGHG